MTKTDPHRVETKHLLLRPPRPDDLDAVFEIHGDPSTNRFNPAGPLRSGEEGRRRLSSWIEHWEEHGFGYWAVAEKARPERVIGFGGIVFKEIAGERLTNLYFRFRPEAWGKGYAGEMAGAARSLAFETLGLSEIAATVRPSNAPSIRVLERLGMVHSGEIEDEWGRSLVYVLWRAKPIR